MKSPLSHLAQVIISLWSQKGEEKLYFVTLTKKSTLLWIVWMREKLKKVRDFFKLRVCSFVCSIVYKSMSWWPFNAFNFKIIFEVENIQVIETQHFLNRMTAVLLYKLDLRLTTVAVYTNTQMSSHHSRKVSVEKLLSWISGLNRSLRQHFVVWYYWKAYYGFSIESFSEVILVCGMSKQTKVLNWMKIIAKWLAGEPGYHTQRVCTRKVQISFLLFRTEI